jgi:hypothetical protein
MNPSPLRRAPALALGALVLFAACQQPPKPQPYTTSATVKDLMQGFIDANADVVWLAVTAETTEKGVVETAPTSDEAWLKVRHGAIALAEAANLLLIPGRPVARPGEKSEVPGVELEPSEMEAMINQDRAAWNKRALALHDAATAVLRAIDAKDSAKVFEIGEQIELACEGCHTHFWYPNEVIPEVPPGDSTTPPSSSSTP